MVLFMDDENINEEEVQAVDIPEEDLEELCKVQGVAKLTAQKLYSGGYTTVLAIAVAPSAELSANCNIGSATAIKIINSARALSDISCETAYSLLEKRQNTERFTTGCKNLDNILGGGIETKSSIEAFGEFRTGKTQLGIQLCITVQLPKEKGGLDGKAYFIDCEGTFRPERISEVYQRYKGVLKSEKDVLNNIVYIRALTSQHLTHIINEIPKELTKHKDRPIKLVLIDSIMTHFRAEYIGRAMLADRQQKINMVLHKLAQISIGYNLAIYYANQVEADPKAMFGDPKQPVGGHIMAHSSTYRLSLRKAKGNKRIATLIDSPCLPERDTVFLITENGIVDES